jgi:hypothetical protein
MPVFPAQTVGTATNLGKTLVAQGKPALQTAKSRSLAMLGMTL